MDQNHHWGQPLIHSQYLIHDQSHIPSPALPQYVGPGIHGHQLYSSNGYSQVLGQSSPPVLSGKRAPSRRSPAPASRGTPIHASSLDVDQLIRSNESYTKETDELKRKLKQLEDDKHSMEKQLAGMSSRTPKLEQDNALLEQAKSSLERTIAGLNEQISHYKSDLSSASDIHMKHLREIYSMISTNFKAIRTVPGPGFSQERLNQMIRDSLADAGHTHIHIRQLLAIYQLLCSMNRSPNRFQHTTTIEKMQLLEAINHEIKKTSELHSLQLKNIIEKLEEVLNHTQHRHGRATHTIHIENHNLYTEIFSKIQAIDIQHAQTIHGMQQTFKEQLNSIFDDIGKKFSHINYQPLPNDATIPIIMEHISGYLFEINKTNHDLRERSKILDAELRAAKKESAGWLDQHNDNQAKKSQLKHFLSEIKSMETDIAKELETSLKSNSFTGNGRESEKKRELLKNILSKVHEKIQSHVHKIERS